MESGGIFLVVVLGLLAVMVLISRSGSKKKGGQDEKAAQGEGENV